MYADEKGASLMHMLRAYASLDNAGGVASTAKQAAAGLPEDMNVGPAQKLRLSQHQAGVLLPVLQDPTSGQCQP